MTIESRLDALEDKVRMLAGAADHAASNVRHISEGVDTTLRLTTEHYDVRLAEIAAKFRQSGVDEQTLQIVLNDLVQFIGERVREEISASESRIAAALTRGVA